MEIIKSVQIGTNSFLKVEKVAENYFALVNDSTFYNSYSTERRATNALKRLLKDMNLSHLI